MAVPHRAGLAGGAAMHGWHVPRLHLNPEPLERLLCFFRKNVEFYKNE